MKFKKLLKAYFIIVSILAHCILIVMVVYFVSEKVTSNWRWPIIKHWVLGDTDKSNIYSLGFNGLKSLPKGRWLKIHQQQPNDSIYFTRQSHAGSSFDQSRSELLIFGSNTHAENWNNSVYTFNMETLRWSETYPPDAPETYTVSLDGFPVAGVGKNHPWAMHTFGALAYDALHDNLVVASYPGHMEPSKYGQSLAVTWKKIKQHPTWLYDSGTKKWQAYTGKSKAFFPYSIAYDSDRGVVVGFRPDGIFEWGGSIQGWKKVGDKVYSEWHTNVVYDSVNQVFILFGGNKMTNNIYTYQTGNKVTQKMPTIGQRPPPGVSVPLAFHKKLGKVVALIDVEGYAQTWLYDYAFDKWERVEGADFPYQIGMNYSMEYDQRHNVLVLVSSPKYEETAVWSLHL